MIPRVRTFQSPGAWDLVGSKFVRASMKYDEALACSLSLCSLPERPARG
jgi:hypothetical protein